MGRSAAATFLRSSWEMNRIEARIRCTTQVCTTGRCQIFCVSSGYLLRGDTAVTMTMSESERAERRERQRELADRLKASGALDEIFEQIDAGEVPLGGDEGLLKGMLKAAL